MNAFARWICLFLVLPAVCAAAQARNPYWTLVLHADDSTGNVWLAPGMANQDGDLSYGMGLVRLQVGRSAFFKDGISYNAGLDNCHFGRYGSCELPLSYEINALFKSLGWTLEIENSVNSLQGESANLGDCAGHWTWTNGQPLCVKGRPARPPQFADEWQSWSGRQKLDLLLELRRRRLGGEPAAPRLSSGASCGISSSAEDRRDCPAWADSFADPIISIAQDVSPLPALPDTARAHLLSGKDFIDKAKGLKDIDNAIGEFSSATDIAPWSSDAYYDLARAETLAGFCRRAYIDFERVLKLRPSPEDAADVRNRMQQLPCQE